MDWATGKKNVGGGCVVINFRNPRVVRGIHIKMGVPIRDTQDMVILPLGFFLLSLTESRSML